MEKVQARKRKGLYPHRPDSKEIGKPPKNGGISK